MPAFTAEQVEAAAKPLADAFEDGKVTLGEVFELAPKLMELVNDVEGMTGAEKHETVCELLEYVLDHTDTAIWWLPDAAVDAAIKAGFRLLFPVIYRAAKGEYSIG